MSSDPTGAAAAAPGLHNDDSHGLDIITVVDPKPDPALAPKTTGLHSPPDSNNVDGSTDSELSDFDEAIADADDIPLDSPPPPAKTTPAAGPTEPPEPIDPEAGERQPGPDEVLTPQEDEDIGEVLPDHWSGTVPVFKPTMDQFKDFKKFMGAVDPYGMKSGIIKIIPPDEWKESLPNIDDLIKTVRVREPIKQDIMGSNGTYRQVNILHQRSYNLPQWRQLCDQSEHQPPARRGERRANADKPKPATRNRVTSTAAATGSSRASTAASPATRGTRARQGRGRGRGRRRGGRGGGRGRPRKSIVESDSDEEEDRPMTPESPRTAENTKPDAVVDSVEQDPGIKVEEEECEDATPRRTGFSRQAKPKVQSTSARRKYSKREGSAMIDEEAFKDWDYKMDISDYTPERCEELERIYWKTLTYATPLYGADLMGTLFHESTELWNLNKLPNLLDVLGTKVPGVNTAYLYMGMWKATFAWHLEDVDLYSINYLHFGAPKQWYSISQADARRFETAMKSIWPTDAKACDQFLRHKAFLISPTHLQQHYNIKVNKCLSYPGEFVVTYPYGYHSGYNLGYNCAEAVNFALDSWLPMGKIAKKCECAQAQDSVWVDVYEIERKLRGEPTPEYWSEEEDDDDDEEDDEEEDDEASGLPSPPSSHAVRIKASGRKRKRTKPEKDGKGRPRKLRLRVRAHVETPCCLCPNDIPGAEILATDDGRKAHRLCALYLPETYVETVDGEEKVFNTKSIEKARMDLRCLFCRSKQGACFQCSQKKCSRSYHATCAAAAGVFIEEGDVPVFDKDGTEYKEQAFEFSCRYHRTKRDKNMDGNALDENARIKKAAAALKVGDTCQMQYFRKELFAGVVVENRRDEQTLLLDILPNGARIEVEYKWLLLPDPSDYHLPKASANARPMPASRKAQQAINAKRLVDDRPQAGDIFVEGAAPNKDYIWSEYHTCDSAECKNAAQAKVDLFKEDQVWHYLAQGSTDTKSRYTEDPSNPQHNPKSNFLDSIPKPPPPPKPQRLPSYGAAHPSKSISSAVKIERPYVYKPKKPVDESVMSFAPQTLAPNPSGSNRIRPLSFGTDPRFGGTGAFTTSRLTPMPNHSQFQQQYQGSVNAQFINAPYMPIASSSQSINPAWLSQQTQQQLSGPLAYQNSQDIPIPSAHSSAVGTSSSSTNFQASTSNAPSQQGISTSIVPQAPANAASQCAWQKFSFFQAYHNRDASRYRTPYALWGGFTNGYEGDLRKHLMKKPEAKPETASFSNRRLSFNLGGGLQGLTRPPSHQHSNSTSSRTSPFTGAASPTSSYASAMSPPPFPNRAHQRTTSASRLPSHPAMRTQASSSSQMIHNAGQSRQVSGSGGAEDSKLTLQTSPFSSTQVNASPLPPISPAGIPSQQPTFLSTSLTDDHPGPCPLQAPADADSETQESPAQQLKQQLRRISDPLISPYRMPRSGSHTPKSSLNRLPRMRTPSQSESNRKKESKPSGSQATTPSELAANGVAVREFPESPADKQDLVEKMMMDLRRASMQSQGTGLGASLADFAASPPSN